MKNYLFALLFFFILIIPPGLTTALFAQIEDLLEQEQESDDQSELIEILRSLQNHPIDLNKAAVHDLEQIPWITGEIAARIVAYRKKLGRFQNIEQLLEIPTIDISLLNKTSPFIVIKSKKPLKVTITGRHRLVRKIEKSKAYKIQKYDGGPAKLYNRIRAKLSPQFAMGTTIERDSGEKYFNDYQSYFFQANNLSGQTKIILGFYQPEFGQGLALWGPYGFGKGNDPIVPIKKRGRGIHPFTSVDENSGLRGVCLQTNLKNVSMDAFYSQSNLDASRQAPDSVGSLINTGYHRTESEKGYKDRVSEQLTGLHVAYAAKILTVGGTFHHSVFDKTFINKNIEKKHFGFTGRENSVLSGYFDLFLPGMNFFGEIARSGNKGNAAYIGVSTSQGPLRFIFSYRNYQPEYTSPHGFGFGDSRGTTQNEVGYYMGLRWRIFKNFLLSGYLDHFRHPWRTFFIPVPVNGRDALILLQTEFNSNLELTLRYKNRKTADLIFLANGIYPSYPELSEKERSDLRLQLDIRELGRVYFRVRAEWNWIRRNACPSSPIRGFLLFTDAKYKFHRWFQMRGRISVFDVDNYDSRIYQYETDLPGVLTNVLMQYRGSRWFVFLDVNYHRKVRITCKYSSTFYDNRKVIGSGLDQITSSFLHQFGIQMDWRF